MVRGVVFAFVSLALSATVAQADHHVGAPFGAGFGGACGAVGCCPQVTFRTVEKTVMVPQMVTETRPIQVTRHRPEQRERTFTVHDRVPETRTVTREYTVVDHETRYRQESYTVMRPVTREVEEEYTVMRPTIETRAQTRTVCRMVPEVQTRTVVECQGHWETRFHPGCGAGHCGCVPCVPQKVWVPNFVERQVEVTVMRPEFVEEPYEFQVTVMRPEVRTRTVPIQEFVPEERTREIPYQVAVPRTETEEIEVTEFRTVAREETETYTVMVPFTVEEEIQVQVCRMVPQVITCQVPQWTCGCGF